MQLHSTNVCTTPLASVRMQTMHMFTRYFLMCCWRGLPDLHPQSKGIFMYETWFGLMRNCAYFTSDCEHCAYFLKYVYKVVKLIKRSILYKIWGIPVLIMFWDLEISPCRKCFTRLTIIHLVEYTYLVAFCSWGPCLLRMWHT